MLLRLLKQAIGENFNKLSLWLTSPPLIYSVVEPFFHFMGMRRKHDSLELNKIKKVLVVRLDEIGDVVLTSPFLRELRRNLPDAKIVIIVKPHIYNLLEFCPYIDEILTFDCNINNGENKELRFYGRVLTLARKHLWKYKFDLAILPRWDIDIYHASHIAYLSGAFWRVAYSERVSNRKSDENRNYDFFFSKLLYNKELKHEVERNLDTLKHIGGRVENDCLELWPTEEDDGFAQDFLESCICLESDFIVGFAPGAGHPKRMWPVNNYIELGEWLISGYGAQIMVLGGKGDESLGDKIKDALGQNVINLCGNTSLRQACAFMRHCHTYIGSDSGLMHIASAMNVPVIEISCHSKKGLPSATNSPERFGPWKVKHKVLSPDSPLAPCFEGCMAATSHCINNVDIQRVKDVFETDFYER